MEDLSEMTEENSVVSHSSKQHQTLDGLTLKLLPVELITNEEPPQIIEFNPETPKSESLEELNFDDHHYEDKDEENIPLLLTNLGTFGTKKCTNKLHFKPEIKPKSPDCPKEIISLSPIGEATILSEENLEENAEKINEEKHSSSLDQEDDATEENNLTSLETAEISEDHIDSLTDVLSSTTVSDEVLEELLKGEYWKYHNFSFGSIWTFFF